MEASKQDKAKNRRLLKLFRITLDEQKQIEDFQLNCVYYSSLVGENPGMDHDHASGLVRGRLDFRLNQALGIIEHAFKKATPYILRQLAYYLEYPPAVEVIGRRFGLIGRAKVKKKMIYGSESGPIMPEKKRRKQK